MNKVLAILAFTLAGCSTMQCTANSQSAVRGSVQVLYDYPKGSFTNLGVIDFDYYQPGFHEPTVNDALPDLKAKALAVGGNALIVRNQRLGQNNNRFITVSAEVLRIESPRGNGQRP